MGPTAIDIGGVVEQQLTAADGRGQGGHVAPPLQLGRVVVHSSARRVIVVDELVTRHVRRMLTEVLSYDSLQFQYKHVVSMNRVRVCLGHTVVWMA